MNTRTNIVAPDYRLLIAGKLEDSFSGSVAPGGKASLKLNDPRLYHRGVLNLTGGLQAEHLDYVLVKYNQTTAFELSGSALRARHQALHGTDPNVTGFLKVDFAEEALNGPGNDFRTSLNVGQEDADARLIDHINYEVKFSTAAPAGMGLTLTSRVGPAIAAIGDEPAGPGMVKRIQTFNITDMKAGLVTLRDLVEPGSTDEKRFIRRIYAKINPLHIADFAIKNGTNTESHYEMRDYLADLAEEERRGRTVPSEWFPLFEGGRREADKIDLAAFSKFKIEMNMVALQDGTPVPGNMEVWVEFEGPF